MAIRNIWMYDIDPLILIMNHTIIILIITNGNIMKDLNILLDQLYEIDEITYYRISDIYYITSDNRIKEFIIIGCVQDSIQEKGLHWDISLDEYLKNYIIDISSIGPGYDGDHWNERHLSLMVEVVDRNLCYAILKAYIEVIKRINKQ